MKLTLYIQDGLQQKDLYRNECVHHFYGVSNLSPDYCFHISINHVNRKRLIKIINYQHIFPTHVR
jgi:hypothetical protein